MHPPTGERFLLTNGSSTAEIGAVAAVLLSVRIDGMQITEPTPADATPSHGSGIVLSPWPNRVRDAIWQLDGVPQQLDVTDPELMNAIHGLLRNVAYRERARTESSVTLGAVVYPQHGWPFLVDTWVRYDLGTDGLTVTHGVENLSGSRAPYAVGSHPYFRIAAVPTEQLTLTITGDRWIELDGNMNPVAEHPVEGTGYDFRGGRLLRDVDLNTDFTGLSAGHDGAACLPDPDGATLTLWVDEPFGWLQTFTPRDFPRDGVPAMAIALEPMTAPADALNSGEGIRWLEPGERWQASWGVTYRPGDTA